VSWATTTEEQDMTSNIADLTDIRDLNAVDRISSKASSL
jgi:hypothetical protein